MNCLRECKPFINTFVIRVICCWHLVVTPNRDLLDVGYMLEDFDWLRWFVFIVIRVICRLWYRRRWGKGSLGGFDNNGCSVSVYLQGITVSALP